MMSDGTKKEIQHNMIALNIVSQAISKRFQLIFPSEIIHVQNVDNVICNSDILIINMNGNKHKDNTTRS